MAEVSSGRASDPVPDPVPGRVDQVGGEVDGEKLGYDLGLLNAGANVPILVEDEGSRVAGLQWR